VSSRAAGGRTGEAAGGMPRCCPCGARVADAGISPCRSGFELEGAEITMILGAQVRGRGSSSRAACMVSVSPRTMPPPSPIAPPRGTARRESTRDGCGSGGLGATSRSTSCGGTRRRWCAGARRAGRAARKGSGPRGPAPRRRDAGGKGPAGRRVERPGQRAITPTARAAMTGPAAAGAGFASPGPTHQRPKALETRNHSGGEGGGATGALHRRRAMPPPHHPIPYGCPEPKPLAGGVRRGQSPLSVAHGRMAPR